MANSKYNLTWILAGKMVINTLYWLKKKPLSKLTTASSKCKPI
jgi:hypothetical protein